MTTDVCGFFWGENVLELDSVAGVCTTLRAHSKPLDHVLYLKRWTL